MHRSRMMALLDGPSFADDKGKTLFSYNPSAVLAAIYRHWCWRLRSGVGPER
jgi:hypothetical protein